MHNRPTRRQWIAATSTALLGTACERHEQRTVEKVVTAESAPTGLEIVDIHQHTNYH